tara:strand:+ start:252 stop:434 length:183 start_codon:yes stop_codon:yes gene_type:complete
MCSLADRKAKKPCPECNKPSKFVISASQFKLEGITGHFPTAASKWERIHETHGELNTKRK